MVDLCVAELSGITLSKPLSLSSPPWLVKHMQNKAGGMPIHH